MIDFTVVIPTYNGASRISDVLEKLRSQTGTENIAWEIIVVDNNSSDQTADQVQNMIASWQEVFPLKYVFEAQQGAAFARQRGLEEAQGELIGFLDDDNWPDENWVVQAHDFARVYPQAGAYGGQIHGVYEVPPPENFKAIEGFLAIRERGPEPNRYQPQVFSVPPGAALVVRRQAWLNSVPLRPSWSGKIPGKAMIQGDDIEPVMYLYKAGWEVWYNPTMQSYHQIPALRLKRDYLLLLIEGSCLPICSLRMLVAQPSQKPKLLAYMILGNTYKALKHWWKYRNHLNSDLIAECELKIYLSRIRSVFYWMRQTLHP